MSLASDYTSGQGGLSFVATAPPGQGRLIRIPFYLETAATGFDAMVPAAATAAQGGANGTADTTSPVILAGPAAAVGIGTNVTMKTPQISWATLRIVGFECSQNKGEVGSLATAAAGATAQLLFKDLQIGGGANLFVHEDYASADIYAAHQGSFSGLRDYPLLKSPNVAQVDVAINTVIAAANFPIQDNAAGIADEVIFTCNLVCEILQDDNYGTHVPGPYARKGAMVRRGGSFV